MKVYAQSAIRLVTLLIMLSSPTTTVLAFVGTRRHGVLSGKNGNTLGRPLDIATVGEEAYESLHDALVDQTDQHDQDSAIEKLSQLRDRQKEEYEETQRLLDLISNPSDPANSNSNNKAYSTAESLLAGFDYGFLSRSEGPPSSLQGSLESLSLKYGGPPGNIWALGRKQFMRNLNAIRGEYSDEPEVLLSPQQVELQAKLDQLVLNSTEIWEREMADGPIEAPWIIKIPYLSVCYLLDVVFDGRNVPSRFFLLETVARMPYMSYIGMLHFYETLGFWRQSADWKRIHFAEEINEYRHLTIMESLGGDQEFWVRFVAQHSAIVYFLVLCALFAISPSLSYRFSELLETHAVNTYSVFLDNNEELLKELPPSTTAVEYYTLGSSDPFYAEFQTAALASGNDIRRPGEKMQSMYAVFSAIRSDEADHVSTMVACLDPEANLRSPSQERRFVTGLALASVAVYVATSMGAMDSGVLDSVDVASDAVMASDLSVVEMITAGATALVQQFVADEKAGDAAAVGTDLLEDGAIVAAVDRVGRISVEAAEIIAKFVVKFL